MTLLNRTEEKALSLLLENADKNPHDDIVFNSDLVPSGISDVVFKNLEKYGYIIEFCHDIIGNIFARLTDDGIHYFEDKEKFMRVQTTKHSNNTYNIHNAGGRVNIDSTDNSTNISLTDNEQQLFSALADIA
ncbi:MAG: hypothetical protein LBL34_02140 [Clostridiales bacterium]|nr:hypothetical protein [Clostridiales bacterium]